MSEEKSSQSLRFSDLDWRKVDGFSDEFADVVSVRASGRGVILEFGSLDYDQTKGGDPVDPHLDMHTRIRVSPNHFGDLVEMFEGFIDENDNLTKGEGEQ